LEVKEPRKEEKLYNQVYTHTPKVKLTGTSYGGVPIPVSEDELAYKLGSIVKFQGQKKKL